MSGIPMHELVREPAELMPRREALGLVNITTITAVNVTIALNAATIGSTAAAGATQGIALFQS
jgi:hypothetical protein